MSVDTYQHLCTPVSSQGRALELWFFISCCAKAMDLMMSNIRVTTTSISPWLHVPSQFSSSLALNNGWLMHECMTMAGSCMTYGPPRSAVQVSDCFSLFQLILSHRTLLNHPEPSKIHYYMHQPNTVWTFLQPTSYIPLR